MIRVETLRVGDVLYDVHRERAGNTTATREGCWEVVVREVGVDDGGRPWALLSWNGNPPRGRTYGTTSYKRSPKEWLYDPWSGRGRRCHLCGAYQSDGHMAHCGHPRAISARKKAAKGPSQ